MNKRIKALLIVPFVVLFSFALFKKNIHEPGHHTVDGNTAIILATSLADTLGEKAFQKLRIADVAGVKVKYPTGNFASYFEYQADHQNLLRAVGSLPAAVYAKRFDTFCRPISYESLPEELHHPSGLEQENASAFWFAPKEDYLVYDCLKAPFRHTLLLHKTTNKVIHRVEFTG